MRAREFILESLHNYMRGHCHVMALALKRIHPNWQVRAHIGWDEDAEDDDDYRVDHVYAVAPDGAAYDCRGRFDSEQQLVGPNEVGVEDTQFVDMDWAEIKRLIWRGELKPFDIQDVERATAVAKQMQLNEIGNTRPEYTRPERQRSGKHKFTTTFTGAKGKQRQVDVYFFYDYNCVEIDFKVDGWVNSYITGGGDAVLILSAVRHLVEQELPKLLKKIPRLKQVRFRSYAEASSRVSLYRNRAVPFVSQILGPDWRYYGDYASMGNHWFYWQHRTATGLDRVRLHGQRPKEQPDEPYSDETGEKLKAWEKAQAQQPVNEVVIDNNSGAGVVPHNMEVDYFGLRVKMRPSVFLKLAAPLNDFHRSTLMRYIADGGAIASPFLTVDIPDAWSQGDFSEPAQVSQHEGRNRMTAVSKLEGDDAVEVHIFPRYYRNRDMTPEFIKNLNRHLRVEDSARVLSGPLFTM